MRPRGSVGAVGRGSGSSQWAMPGSAGTEPGWTCSRRYRWWSIRPSTVRIATVAAAGARPSTLPGSAEHRIACSLHGRWAAIDLSEFSRLNPRRESDRRRTLRGRSGAPVDTGLPIDGYDLQYRHRAVGSPVSGPPARTPPRGSRTPLGARWESRRHGNRFGLGVGRTSRAGGVASVLRRGGLAFGKSRGRNVAYGGG